MVCLLAESSGAPLSAAAAADATRSDCDCALLHSAFPPMSTHSNRSTHTDATQTDEPAPHADDAMPPPPHFHDDAEGNQDRAAAEADKPPTQPLEPQLQLESDRGHSSSAILHEAQSIPSAHVPASWTAAAGSAPLTMDEFLRQSRFEARADTHDSRGSHSNRSSVSSRYPSQLPSNSRSRSGGLSLSGHSMADSTRSHSTLSTTSGGGSVTRKFAFPSATRLDFNSQPVSRNTTAPSTPIAEEDDTKAQLKTDNVLVEEEQTTSIEPAPTIIESYIPIAERPRTEHGIAPSLAVGIFGGAIYGSVRS